MSPSWLSFCRQIVPVINDKTFHVHEQQTRLIRIKEWEEKKTSLRTNFPAPASCRSRVYSTLYVVYGNNYYTEKKINKTHTQSLLHRSMYSLKHSWIFSRLLESSRAIARWRYFIYKITNTMFRVRKARYFPRDEITIHRISYFNFFYPRTGAISPSKISIRLFSFLIFIRVKYVLSHEPTTTKD